MLKSLIFFILRFEDIVLAVTEEVLFPFSLQNDAVCFFPDTLQKGHQINEETAEELLDKGLIEGESPNYQISLGVAKMTHQLPEYTRVSGLERSKLKQMTLQFIQNAGEDGTMRDGIYEYLKVAMPSNKTKEQNLRLLGNILKELKEEGAVSLKGLSWYEVQNPTKKN